ncbi:MAG: NAD-dependent epimerase/dehydratase family protein [Limisphaerales bacterium]
MRAAVTGAFGYSGRYIAGRLIAGGHEVLTLTNSLNRPNPFGNQIQIAPFHFDQPELLAGSLQGVQALINTYWVRFDHKLFTHAQAVENTRILFNAAVRAGVRRIVHVSITNPDLHSGLPYFSGKAELEQNLQALDVSWCILRPTVLFGKEDVLINNIAWTLRHLPVFGVYGKGDYAMQPIYVEDLALAAVEKAGQTQDEIVEAIGPETFTYRELVRMIANTLELKRAIIGVSPALGYWAGRMVGWLVRDVVITREEIQGLMENRLFVKAPALGKTRLTDWVAQNKNTLGRHYTSEMLRRTDRTSKYKSN